MKTDIISNKWTARELKQYIRQATQEVNTRILEYNESTEPGARNPLIEAERQRLIDISGVKGKNGFIGTGLEFKNKPALIQQARALQDFIDADIYSPTARSIYSEKEQAAYDAFIQNHPEYNDMSPQEYHDFIEAMGALGSHVTSDFIDSDTVLHLYDQAGTKEKRSLASAMKNVLNRSKGQGFDQEQMIVLLRNELNIGD